MAENFKKLTVEQINAEYGKMPPQAADLEEVVLGALLLEKNAILEVIDILKPESFYKEEHRKIYQAALSLSINTQPIDIMTVTEELRKSGDLETVGGPYYITQLTSRVASAANIEFHARIIAQKAIQRDLINITSEIQTKAYDNSIDVDDLLDFSERQLFNLSYGNIKKEASKIDNIMKAAIKEIEEAGKREDGLSGVPCGFTKLDRMTSGWQRSDMIIVAARPSMGKTSFVLSMARNIAINHKRGIAFFSLEMSSLQLVNRLIVAESEIPHDRIKTGRLLKREWDQLEYKTRELFEAPIFIDDTPAISIFELRAKCRRLKMQYDIDLIVIDYLQLMTVGGDMRSINREQEVSMISRALKAIAKELNVPVIALSQLNRSVEMRSGDKRPQLSDLRESGAIEQDADLVLFIHRPERFGLLEDDEGNSTKGLAQIIVAKHRNGPIGDVNLRFIDDMAKFVDMEELDLNQLSSDDDMNSIGEVTFESKMNTESFAASNDDPLGGTKSGAEEPPPF